MVHSPSLPIAEICSCPLKATDTSVEHACGGQPGARARRDAFCEEDGVAYSPIVVDHEADAEPGAQCLDSESDSDREIDALCEQYWSAVEAAPVGTLLNPIQLGPDEINPLFAIGSAPNLVPGTIVCIADIYRETEVDGQAVYWVYGAKYPPACLSGGDEDTLMPSGHRWASPGDVALEIYGPGCGEIIPSDRDEIAFVEEVPGFWIPTGVMETWEANKAKAAELEEQHMAEENEKARARDIERARDTTAIGDVDRWLYDPQAFAGAVDQACEVLKDYGLEFSMDNLSAALKGMGLLDADAEGETAEQKLEAAFGRMQI